MDDFQWLVTDAGAEKQALEKSQPVTLNAWSGAA